MPVYRFNLCDSESILDGEGTDLPDDKTAHAHAVAVARELMFRNRDMLGEDWTHYKLSVLGPDGNEVWSFSLSDFGNGT